MGAASRRGEVVEAACVSRASFLFRGVTATGRRTLFLCVVSLYFLLCPNGGVVMFYFGTFSLFLGLLMSDRRAFALIGVLE